MVKKIFFSLLLIFLCLIKVHAKEIKGENNFLWQEEELEGENVELQFRYKFYKEVKNGKYLRKGQVSEYEYEDLNNVRYGPYSNYQVDCQSKPGYRINYGKMYKYQELLPIRYVKITNISNEKVNIKDISVYSASKKIDYEIETLIEDNLIDSFDNIIIYLSNNVNLYNFKINLELSNKDTSYEILLSNDNSFSDNKIVSRVIGNSKKTMYFYDDNFILYENYGDIKTDYNIVVRDFMKVISVDTVCRFSEIFTYHYNIEKEYYDDNYYEDISNLTDLSDEDKILYKKDLDSYKIYYRYNHDVFESSNFIDVTEDIKLVNTGIIKEVNYGYLVVYVLFLILLALIMIKHIKKNVD